MSASRALIPLSELLVEDLQRICSDLEDVFSTMAGQRLLITGGGGFLGYYLVQSVLYWNAHFGYGRPIEVVVYDNYLRGIPGWLLELEGHHGLKLLRWDVSQPMPVNAGHFDYIVHAAGIASPMHYRAQPLACIDANINGLRHLLDYAVAEAEDGRPLRGLLFFSSSEIYGDPPADAVPTPETYRGNVSCTGPRACYDEAKRFGETLCVTYARSAGVPTRIARPFNNYGPGLKLSDGRVISDFARDVLAGRDIVMYSDGRPTRTFCYVTDAIAGYFRLLVHGRDGEAYNIGIDRPEISMTDLAEMIVRTGAELFDYGGQVRHVTAMETDYLADNPMRRCPAIDKARIELGFDPHVLVDEGVYRSLCWYARQPLAEAA